MLTSIQIDGQWYHAQSRYDDELEDYVSAEPVLDENNQLIPLSICLCFARTPSECCCATSSWDNYRYDESDY